MLETWDGGVGTAHLEKAARTINASVFWSFGKLVALRQEDAPLCVLDTDLIVWSGIGDLVTEPVMSLHEEPLHFAAYVGRDRLVAAPAFDWDGLDWTATPCSGALLVFTDESFKNAYAERALSFMDGNPLAAEPGGTIPVHPIFVEQRLLPMCARASGVRIGSFLRDHNGVELHSGARNTLFTHLWNAKTALHADPKRRAALCAKYAARLARDHPDTAGVLAKTALVGDYFQR